MRPSLSSVRSSALATVSKPHPIMARAAAVTGRREPWRRPPISSASTVGGVSLSGRMVKGTVGGGPGVFRHSKRFDSRRRAFPTNRQVSPAPSPYRIGSTGPIWRGGVAVEYRDFDLGIESAADGTYRMRVPARRLGDAGASSLCPSPARAGELRAPDGTSPPRATAHRVTGDRSGPHLRDQVVRGGVHRCGGDPLAAQHRRSGAPGPRFAIAAPARLGPGAAGPALGVPLLALRRPVRGALDVDAHRPLPGRGPPRLALAVEPPLGCWRWCRAPRTTRAARRGTGGVATLAGGESRRS